MRRAERAGPNASILFITVHVIPAPIKEINDRAIEEGLLIIQAQGNVIRFVPPLIVEKEHIDQMVEKMRRILA